MSRIVLFGATGYTGRLTAEALVRRGATPLLAARDKDKLAALNDALGGGLDTAVADVATPESVQDLVDAGDVLVSTVGPFVHYGAAAAEAAIHRNATYLDSTGEPVFIRRVFEEYGPRASAPMLTAFGYDYLPGNLSAAVALRAAPEATRVDVGYFATGKGALSAGTFASLTSGGTASFRYAEGAIGDDAIGARARTFDVDGTERDAIAIGSSEHFTLPRLAPALTEVNGYLGWFGKGSSLSAATPPAPGTGPDEETRKQGGSHVVAIAYDASGAPLAEAHATGVDGYTFTAEILAWGAMNAQRIEGTGALGPVEAFALAAFTEGCASAGIVVR